MIGQKEVQKKEAQRMHMLMKVVKVPVVSGIAVDGGAHVGSWTVEMAKYFHTIHAFEPCWDSHIALCENIINSDLDAKIIPYQQALLNERTRVRIHAPKGRTTLTARQVRINPGGPVEAIPLDDLQLEGCDFIKLDLEGAEALALKGARKTIKKYKPFLVIEFNNLVRQFGSSENAILRMLVRMGYRQCWQDGVDRGFIWVGK